MKSNSPLFAALALLTAQLHADPPGESLDFLEQHCWDCHDDAKPKAGLNLMDLDFDPKSPGNLAIWTHVHDRVTSGEMPPKDKDQPQPSETKVFLRELGNPLLSAWEGLYKEEGRTVGRRLNPTEYEYTLRDLLHAPWLEIKEVLPPDPSVHGFDKNLGARHQRT